MPSPQPNGLAGHAALGTDFSGLIRPAQGAAGSLAPCQNFATKPIRPRPVTAPEVEEPSSALESPPLERARVCTSSATPMTWVATVIARPAPRVGPTYPLVRSGAGLRIRAPSTSTASEAAIEVIWITN